MNPDEPINEASVADAFEEASQHDGTESPSVDPSADLANEFSAAVDLLCELSQGGLADHSAELQSTVEQLSTLADSVESSLTDFHDDDPEVIELLGFVVESCELVRNFATEDHSATEEGQEAITSLRDEVQERLEACNSEAAFGNAFSDSFEQPGWDEEQDTEDASADESLADGTEVAAPSQEEIAQLLSQLSAQTQLNISESSSDATAASASGDSSPVARESNESEAFIRSPAAADAPKVGNSQIAIPEPDDVEVDSELREAFMDDATRGLESMEQALLDLETNPGDAGVIKTIGRELHTIKGAAASISLANLASYIHEVEELIRQTQDAGHPVTPELLLPHVDLIRARVDGKDAPDTSDSRGESPAASGANPPASNIVQPAPNPGATVPSVVAGIPNTAVAAPPTKPKPATSHGDDETVRVKASQLNRLMDMLSELVMLRNQRDTEISELKGIHDELIHSVTRIRMLSHEGEALLAGDHLTNPQLAEDGVSFSHLNEVANDVLESAQRLRECYRPVADGNQAVSQFIRNFRLELVQLRRMPVSGLFRRLHRAISDAARSEQKQVRVELIGDDTGIERSLQERIFEPLLHIVRNSVSHGIETPEQRIAAGKPAQGVVQLHAHSGPDL
ncbi:MAG: Hpt domain-containing protein, partial [Planctomycetota bacterium]